MAVGIENDGVVGDCDAVLVFKKPVRFCPWNLKEAAFICEI